MDVDEETSPAAVADDFDEAATYAGKVLKFRANSELVITPNDDLEALGVKNSKIPCSISDAQTNESPLYLAKDQEVEFRLRKDDYGTFAYFVSGPGGSFLTNTDAPEAKEAPGGARTALNEGQTYQGTVKVFQWGPGFGYVTLSEDAAFEMPEADFPGKAKFEKAKKLWFHRGDILSTDAAVGLAKDQEVQFSIYTDEKGVGAQNVCAVGGAPITGARNELRRKPKQKKNKKRKAGEAGINMQNMKGCQMVMMNGIPYMLMPMPAAGGAKKKRKSNRTNNSERGQYWEKLREEGKAGDWKCSECDYENWNRRTVCNECGKGTRPADIEVLAVPDQPEREMEEGDWKCAKCDFHNFARRDKCRDCGEEKPSAGGETGGDDAVAGMEVSAL